MDFTVICSKCVQGGPISTAEDAILPGLEHTLGKVRAGTGSPKMAFEEASRLLDPSWRDCSMAWPLARAALAQYE